MKGISLAIWTICLLFAALFVNGCGGSSSGANQVIGSVIVKITPGSVTVNKGLTQQFTAEVTGSTNKAVKWRFRVGEENTSGTLSASGLYTAPNAPGTFTIIAESAADPNSVGTATVTVPDIISLSIATPDPAVLAIPKSNLFFTANVLGTDRTGVTWSINEGASGGTINKDGKYTAPNTPGTYTVVATSKADPTKTASFAVNVLSRVFVRLDVENRGVIMLDLQSDQAPNTCANFASLVNKQFYDGIIFHRYEVDFVIQGGDPLTKTLPLDDGRIGTGGAGYTIPFEPNPLKHEQGALAMARGDDKDSASSQFYICLQKLTSLDGNYTVFGRTANGFDIVQTLRRGDKITSMRTVLPQ